MHAGWFHYPDHHPGRIEIYGISFLPMEDQVLITSVQLVQQDRVLILDLLSSGAAVIGCHSSDLISSGQTVHLYYNNSQGGSAFQVIYPV